MSFANQLRAKRTCAVPFRYSLLSAVILAFAAGHAQGGTLDGQQATVNPGDAPENWTLDNGSSLTVNSGGQTNEIDATDSEVNLDGTTVIDTAGASHMVDLLNSTATINNSTLVSTSGEIGLMLRNSTATITGSTISSDGAIGLNLVSDNSCSSFICESTSVATITDSSITGTRGINTNPGAQVFLSGSQVRGIDDGGSALGTGGAVVLFGGSVQASNGTTLVGDTNGAVLASEEDPDGTFDATLILDNSSVQGVNGSAILVSTLNGLPDADATIVLRNGSTATGGNGTLLEVQGTNSAHLFVDNSQVEGNIVASEESSTDVTLQNGSSLTGELTGVDSFSIFASQFTGTMTVASGEASMIVADGSTVNANSPVLDVQGGSAELIVDNSTVNGDVIASADGSATVTLQNFGVLNGQLDNVSLLNVNGGATWNMVDDARVENVAMGGGTISLGDGSTYHTLTLGSLSGNGTFAMNTDIAAGKGDLLNVEGEATGNHQLQIKNTGAEVQDGSLQVVHTGGGDAQFGVLGGAVDVGTYEYQLAQHGNDWFLEATNEITPSTASVLGLFSAAPSVWYGELSSLRSRMGEVRNGQGSGVWARTYTNRYKLSAASNLTYDQDQSGFSVGADGQLPTGSGQWLLGVMAGTSKSDLDLKRGTSGDIDSYYVGLYSTWLAESGYYVDAVVKLNRFDNSSDVRMSDGTKAKGSYDNNGVGVSVEAGKHIKLEDDWFVEPFAQIASLWVDGDKYHLDNGMQAQSNHANSLLGKVGTSFGKRIALANGGFAEPYAKLAVAHEFVDNNQVEVNSDRFTNDLSGTRGEIGGGVALQVSDRLQMHFDVDYSKGNNVEQPYGVNLGLRYNF